MPKKVVSPKKSAVSTKKVVTSKRVDYENGMEDFFLNKLPSLPEGVKEFLVNFSPWIVLVMLVMMLPAVLAVFGLGAMMAPFGYMMGGRFGYGYSITWIISLVSFALTVFALPGLFKRQMSAWKLMFYSVFVTAVGSLLSGEIISMIVGAAISLYILYQIKSYYK
jgi:hypothetical protein